VIRQILIELRRHAPFTAFGAASGVAILIITIFARVFVQVSEFSSIIFYILHPTHIVLSAIVTTAIYRLHTDRFNLIVGILIGYVGSIGIATISDSIIPYLGELILDLPHKGVHIGFIEKPWLTNPAAFLGILIAFLRPVTKFPHSGHVLISTWASLFHIMMAVGQTINPMTIITIFVFLFLAVWFPCCLSDIIFPLLFVPVKNGKAKKDHRGVKIET
jgi:hypothetical protein